MGGGSRFRSQFHVTIESIIGWVLAADLASLLRRGARVEKCARERVL